MHLSRFLSSRFLSPAADQIFILNNNTGSAAVTNPYDINRDGVVDSTDQAIAASNPTNSTTALELMVAPVEARSSYVVDYYDASNRLTAEANVGTNGGSAYTRPGSAPSPSDTVLVTSYAYLADNMQRDNRDSHQLSHYFDIPRRHLRREHRRRQHLGQRGTPAGDCAPRVALAGITKSFSPRTA